MNARYRFDDAIPVATDFTATGMGAARPGVRPLRSLAFDGLNPLPSDQLFVPDGYEPNYAYPLIVWVLPASGHWRELHRLMTQVSHRNYLGMAFRVESSDLDAACSGIDADEVLTASSQRLESLVQRLRHDYHVHSERVYLAGFDAAATFALGLGLTHPEWFAGVAAFGGGMPAVPHLLARLDDLRGRRVMLGTGERDRAALPTEASRISRLLQSAGLRVCHRLYEAGHELTRSMLLELDRWVMKGVHEEVGA